MLSACAVVPLHQSVPEAQLSAAHVAGFGKDIRFWADDAPAHFEQVVLRGIERYRTMHAEYYKEHGRYPALHYLAISGGAYDGAFGAGLLCGWSATGNRPDFALVTGVSTGALIAPFVYIGREHDASLKEFFTQTRSDNIFIVDALTALGGIAGGLAVTDSTPLAEKIAAAVTDEVMEKIAAEYKKGKQLLLATTNVEAQRGMIWDIGAIAASGNPGAKALVHKVMLASASVPGLFSPVFIDVEIDGKRYSEIHVDGGTTSQVFAYPMKLKASTVKNISQGGLKRHLYIVRNGKITPEYHKVEPGLFSVAGRSVETLIKYQGLGDLYRLYVTARRDGVEYHLKSIPEGFMAESHELFDPDYMGKLFEVGMQMGMEGPSGWESYPPGVAYSDVRPARP